MESPDEQSSRAWDLAEEIDKKLTQAKGICGVMMHLERIDSLIGDSLWAASELIEETQKGVRELYQLKSTKDQP